jgi:amino acid permease
LNGQELDQIKLRHIYTAIDFSVLFVGILYCIVGLCGFLTFGKATDMIILNNYTPTVSVLLGKLAYCGLAALSFPEQAQTCRVALDSLWDTLRDHSMFQKYSHVPSDDKDEMEYPQLKKKLSLFTWIIIVVSFGFAFSVSNLNLYLALVGATGGVAMCYVLPAVFIWKLGLLDFTTQSTAFMIAVLGIACGSLQVFSLFIR